ncbi:hypothetical protein HMPREF0004_3153 [Achromobacter piechaudii ATCC 43553]|uniref:Uncharacterized protein n=1 Tax=Achromobacter piechaudii ATCC 43553 TaxID=742159 RepID=D4XCF6_9BURK|nr:hypothetical protein HMPREF0004_3153 [Achromobacter piechaudii ATCC 43553]
MLDSFKRFLESAMLVLGNAGRQQEWPMGASEFPMGDGPAIRQRCLGWPLE